MQNAGFKMQNLEDDRHLLDNGIGRPASSRGLSPRDMLFRALLARQLARPHGLGGLFMGRTLNRVNRTVNRLGLERLSLEPTDHLLDVGFGGGLLIELALPRTPAGFIAGIEISQPMLKRALRAFQEPIRTGRLELLEGDVAAIPYPDCRFDKGITINTLHFWPDPAAGCRELWRVLKPGGRLVLAVRPKKYLEQIRFTRHGFTAFDDGELRALLTGAGFDEVRIESHDDRGMGIVMVVASRP
jgi:SAM-dependent methyltransferase